MTREDVIRNSNKFFIFTAMSLLLTLLLATHAATVKQQNPADAETAELARRLKLTDLCLFTEARYTRHPSMADNHAAFQEHPSAFDHFPSGSFLMPQRMSGRPR